MMMLNRAGARAAANFSNASRAASCVPVVSLASSSSSVAVATPLSQQRTATTTSDGPRSFFSALSSSSPVPSSHSRCHGANSRCYSSTSKKLNSANVTPAAADRRLAGRRRFYKHVGIAPASPPSGDHPMNKGKGSSAQKDDSVQSPISAGVDGTQSATGVNISVPDAQFWSSMLNPKPKQKSTSWHTVTLDNRPLRTPLGLPLILPSPLLALAVASEWDAQKKYLQPAQMPLMTLCCTAIDQVASDPSLHRTDVLRYLRNDTSCYWACPTEDRVLHRKQSQAWDGLHTTLSSQMLGLPDDLKPALARGGEEALWLSRRSTQNGESGLPHPPVLVKKAEEWVDGLDAWTLAALYSACAESKSFFIGGALIHDAMMSGGESQDEKQTNSKNNNAAAAKDGKWAVNASRVEEEFNIECWGLVEGGHDYDRLNCSIQMHAAAFLARTVASSSLSA